MLKATLCLALVSLPVAMGASTHSGLLDCWMGKRKVDSINHKDTYYIGVHAPGGIDVAVREYNMTFETYLTATAGKRFDPPIQFKMKPTTTPIYSWVDVDDDDLDFIYSDTGVYSCVGVERGAQPVVTTISHRVVRGYDYDLDMFAGVIFTRADNDEIQSIQDLTNKTIAALEIGDFAGAQVQFYAMHKAGLNYIMDPSQVMFVGNQYKVVKDVLNGVAEVGMVRTGQIEITTDENGEILDPDLFKVLDPKIFVMSDGALFPFLHSTPVFPEWPLAAFDHVPEEVIEEVQTAMIAMGKHLEVGKLISNCYKELGAEICANKTIEEFQPGARCDTTNELAELAMIAGSAGHIDGFRPPRSHFDLRSMQQAAGFLRQDSRGEWKCTRAETLYDAVICPEGTYKLNEKEYERSCERMGIRCPEGASCFCKPCVSAFEMDIYDWNNETQIKRENHRGGCEKMSLCGIVEQTRTVTFRAFDNTEKKDPDVEVTILVGQERFDLPVTKLNESHAYEFSFSSNKVGVGIVEVSVNGVQIPESPFRVQVINKNCDLDYPGEGKVSNEWGDCECGSGTIQISGECMNTGIFAAIMSVVFLVIAFVIGYAFLRYKRRKNDEMWLVNLEELHFGDPVEIIGQGSFGVVLLAEYRGTSVAIKRALPPGKKGGSKKGSKVALGSGNGGSQEKDDGMLQNGSVDPEGGIDAKTKGSKGSFSARASGFSGSHLSFLGDSDLRGTAKGLARWCPLFFKDQNSRFKQNILGTNNSTSRKTLVAALCPCFDRATRQKEEFLEEMRLLSRLRHPCITTVMGAVMSNALDPMLVMEYMEYGSLYDLLHNETMFLNGEIILQMTRDIAQGLRYLHTAKPPILHGDLKGKNILVDARFRAKVADFGLATKKKNGISGTPFWLAPEYLLGKTEYNATCDMYSVGIIFFEIYSRRSPYEGENFKTVLRNVCDRRKNYRPLVPECCPPKMVDLMKKLWSPDPFFRPQAKDLDIALMDMNSQDTEPISRDQENQFTSEKPTKEMIYETFPKHIADALKNGHRVEPEQHELVTVVFADIACLHEITKAFPQKVVTGAINRLHLALDKLAKEHHVFKVETVGDAWMGVTNLDAKQDHDHVKAVSEFAVEAIKTASEIPINPDAPKRGNLRIRIGLHSGPVVSNVIGTLNPRYGLFGDTVNTASRMETNSIPNRILCTDKSAILLREQDPKAHVSKRGKIAIKGKGEMVTYWIGDLQHLGGSDDEEKVRGVSFDGMDHLEGPPAKAGEQNKSI